MAILIIRSPVFSEMPDALKRNVSRIAFVLGDGPGEEAAEVSHQCHGNDKSRDS